MGFIPCPRPTPFPAQEKNPLLSCFPCPPSSFTYLGFSGKHIFPPADCYHYFVFWNTPYSLFKPPSTGSHPHHSDHLLRFNKVQPVYAYTGHWGGRMRKECPSLKQSTVGGSSPQGPLPERPPHPHNFTHSSPPSQSSLCPWLPQTPTCRLSSSPPHSPCWLLWYTPELLNPGPTGELPRGSESPKILHPVLYLSVSVSGGETLTCTMFPTESMTPNWWSTTIPGLYLWTVFWEVGLQLLLETLVKRY